MHNVRLRQSLPLGALWCHAQPEASSAEGQKLLVAWRLLTVAGVVGRQGRPPAWLSRSAIPLPFPQPSLPLLLLLLPLVSGARSRMLSGEVTSSIAIDNFSQPDVGEPVFGPFRKWPILALRAKGR